MVMSFTTFSAEVNSVDSFLSILPLGEHSGKNHRGENCLVQVLETNYPSKSLLVEVKAPRKKLFKMIKEGSLFSYSFEAKEFSQGSRHYVDETRSVYVDKTITLKGTAGLFLDVVITNETLINRERLVETAGCILSL